MAILLSGESGHVEDPRNNDHPGIGDIPPYITTTAIIVSNNGVYYNFDGKLSNGDDAGHLVDVIFDVEGTWAVNVRLA